MEVKTSAIVLRNVKFGDDKIIVDLLTETMGRVSFVCRISKNGKGRIRKLLFQPMQQLEITFDHHPNANLQHFKDARLSIPLRTIPTDPYKLAICLFLAEFLHAATRSEQANRNLFQYIAHSLAWLDGTSEGFANFHVVFMLRLSRFLGFFPNLDDFVEGDFFDLREGVFVPIPPMHTDVIAPADAGKIITLMRLNYQTMHLYRMSHDDRNRCVEAILQYYKLHTPAFPELKSIDVVRELFV